MAEASWESGTRPAIGIRQAMGDAIREAVRDHKRAGNPIAVWDWEKNEVVIVPPEKINVPDEEDVRDESVETRTGGISPHLLAFRDSGGSHFSHGS